MLQHILAMRPKSAVAPNVHEVKQCRPATAESICSVSIHKYAKNRAWFPVLGLFCLCMKLDKRVKVVALGHLSS